MKIYRMNLLLLKMLQLWEKHHALGEETTRKIIWEWVDRLNIADEEREVFFSWAGYRTKYYLLKSKVRHHIGPKKSVGFSELRRVLLEMEQMEQVVPE